MLRSVSHRIFLIDLNFQMTKLAVDNMSKHLKQGNRNLSRNSGKTALNVFCTQTEEVCKYACVVCEWKHKDQTIR